MSKRFLILTTSHAGTVEMHGMKAWLRKHPEQMPPEFTPHHKTSHQLRSELRRMGWIVQETEDEVRLIKPAVATDAITMPVLTRTNTEMAKLKSAGAIQTGPLEIFCSYSHRDEKLRKELEQHFANLFSEGLISYWNDRKIGPGIQWENDIHLHLRTAKIILLLISVDFLASKYCHNVEVKHALERHNEGSARVIPIILRDCDWKNSPIGKLQALPRDGKPVVSWSKRDSAFTEIVTAIRGILKDFSLPRNPPIVSDEGAEEYFVAHPGKSKKTSQ